MENIKLNIENSVSFMAEGKLAAYEPLVKTYMETLE